MRESKCLSLPEVSGILSANYHVFRWPKIAIALWALILFSAPGFAQQQQKPEPDRPTIAETLNYIHSYTSTDFELNGVMLNIEYNEYQGHINLLSISPSDFEPSGDEVEIWGRPMGNCFDATAKSKKGKSRCFARLTLRCSDASIAPHVAKAFQHLTALVKQQNEQPVGPF